jgi:surface antigen
MIPIHIFQLSRLALPCVFAALLAAAALSGCASSASGDRGAREPGKNDDFGIPSGQCNRRAIGAVLGGALGGVIGAQVGESVGKKIATVIGAAAGSYIGSEIGRRMDETDRACIGEGLEKARDNQRVEWPSADGGATYRLTPLSSFEQDGRPCRAFALQTESGGRPQTGAGQACRGRDGVWRVME